MNRVLPPRSGNHPHEILICIAMVFAGSLGLVAPTGISRAVADAFPNLWELAYFAGVLVSGLVTLFGVWRQGMKPITGRLIERTGLSTGSIFLAAYVVAIWTNVGLVGALASVMPTFVILANSWRIYHIHNDLRAVKEWLSSTETPEKDLRG